MSCVYDTLQMTDFKAKNISLPRKKAIIMITDDGVSLEYTRSGEHVHTNLIPSKIFPNKKELNWNNIMRIVQTLEDINCEGKVFSAEEMKKFYEDGN